MTNVPNNSDDDVAGREAGTERRSVSRRDLLKGVVGGSAVVVAVRPIETLATSGPILKVTGKNNVCSISGMQSAGTSPRPGATYCGGKSPGWYNANNIGNWPYYNSTTGKASFTVNGKTYFSSDPPKTMTPSGAPALFPKYSGSATTLIGIMPPGSIGGAGEDEMHWLCAVLNAIKFPTTFPYTAAEVMAFYNSSNPAVYANALSFFKTTPGLEA